MFFGHIGADDEGHGLTHEQFLKVFSTGNGFTSGCGIEYSESDLVRKDTRGDKDPITGTDYLAGNLDRAADSLV